MPPKAKSTKDLIENAKKTQPSPAAIEARQQLIGASVVAGAVFVAATAGGFACGRSTQCKELKTMLSKQAAAAVKKLSKLKRVAPGKQLAVSRPMSWRYE